MNIRQLTGTLGAALAFAASAGPVAASTCYVVLDRGENVIYQGTQPPVDLSVATAWPEPVSSTWAVTRTAVPSPRSLTWTWP